ncbi:SbcC/MukB-like Walker B domain-containing protein [Tepidibacillus sp. LV47]|uniref:SbcC/MukB-like Walker B domain-containing protein n=1 Tax=Tepidibacillus sp. LV47 TaxID=3398228 RepID=UPI003AACBB43
MRPISLTLSGLHSFRKPQTIDFTQVTDTGIFGIFGPTGSGKSTILDAITLALYGEVERSEANRVGIVNQQEDKIHVKFTFELHSGEQYERYTVERIYTRNKEQRIRSTLARLLRIENGVEVPIADRETEVTRKIQNLLGLEFKDFKRAVVLPQGKFAEFLTLKAQERRPMLERLFHLDEYGKQLKERANKHEAKLRNQINEVLIKQEMLSSSSEEYVSKLAEEIEEIQQLIQKQSKEYEQFLKEFEQFQHDWNIQQELRQIQKQLYLLSQKDKEIEILKEKQEKGEKASFIEPTLRRYESLEKLTGQYQKTIEESLILLEQVKELAEQRRREYENLKDQYEREQKDLMEKRIFLKQALQWEKEIAEINERLKQLKSSLHEKQKELEEHRKKYQADHQTLLNIEKQLTQIKDKIVKAQVSAEKRKRVEQAWEIRTKIESLIHELNRRNQEMDELDQKIVKVNEEIEKHLHLLKETEKEILQIEKQMQEHETSQMITEADWNQQDRALLQIDILIKQLRHFSEVITNIEEERATLQTKKENLVSSINEVNTQIQQLEIELMHKEEEKKRFEQFKLEFHAAVLAKNLEPGQPCMVCGSTEHPAPKHLDTDFVVETEKLESIKNQIISLKEKLVKKQGQKMTLAQQIEYFDDQIKKLSREIEKNRSQYNKLIFQLPKEYQGLTIKQMTDRWNQERESLNHLKVELEQYIENQRKLSERWQQEKANLEQHQHKIDLLTTEKNLYINQRNAIDESMEPIKNEIAQFQELWNQMGLEFAMDDLVTIRQQIQEFDKKREELERLHQGLEIQFQEVSNEEKRLLEKINHLQLQIEQDNKIIQSEFKELNKLNDKYIMLTNGRTTHELLQEIDERLQQLNEKVQMARNAWEQAMDQYNEIDKKLSSDQAVYSNLQSQFEEVSRDLISFLRTNQWHTIEELKMYLLTEKELQQIREEIKEFEQQKRILTERERTYINTLKGKNVTEEKWNQMLNNKKQREEQLHLIRQKFSQKEFEYQNAKQDYEKWKELEKQRKEIQEQLDIASELNQVLRGNSFIDFVAQEYLRNITIIASGKLLQLTRNRYRLEVDEEGSFQIVDEFNGGLSRPVRTLSGGETFLTSLALALALSSQIQLKGGVPLEFFFLDEGFGTLDSDLLDTVMMTLEKLHSENMVIGIISHVPELKNRLHRKVMVIPADDRGNGSRIVIESA